MRSGLLSHFGTKQAGCAAAAFILVFSGRATAEIFRYTDEEGQAHYVDRADKVPEKFKGAAEASHGKLSKMPARAYAEETDSASAPDVGSPHEVAIFVTSWCHFCKQAEDYLKSKHIRFTRYDIEHDPAGKRKFLQLGGGGYPLIKVGSTILHGYNEKNLESALSKRYKS